MTWPFRRGNHFSGSSSRRFVSRKVNSVMTLPKPLHCSDCSPFTPPPATPQDSPHSPSLACLGFLGHPSALLRVTLHFLAMVPLAGRAASSTLKVTRPALDTPLETTLKHFTLSLRSNPRPTHFQGQQWHLKKTRSGPPHLEGVATWASLEKRHRGPSPTAPGFCLCLFTFPAFVDLPYLL